MRRLPSWLKPRLSRESPALTLVTARRRTPAGMAMPRKPARRPGTRNELPHDFRVFILDLYIDLNCSPAVIRGFGPEFVPSKAGFFWQEGGLGAAWLRAAVP